MADGISRRRALARSLALCVGLGLSSLLDARSVAAQPLDPPGDAPWPDPSPASIPRADDSDGAPSVGQADGADEPSDELLPSTASTGPWGVPPAKLMIPALGIEALVEAVGQDPDGAMSVPTFPDDIAWYKLGPGMGVPGNAVFAGHINWDNRPRAFGLLDRLVEGDAVQVIDEQGHGFEYTVESSHWVRAEGAPLEEIFAQPEYPQVTLITCGGEYIAATREYLDRLIVKARGA